MALTDKFIKEQKQKLTKKRDELVLEIERLKSQDPFMEEAKEGRNEDELIDEVVEQVTHSELQEKIDNQESILKQVLKALNAIDNNQYGVDENTGETISIERLKAYPEATTAN